MLTRGNNAMLEYVYLWVIQGLARKQGESVQLEESQQDEAEGKSGSIKRAQWRNLTFLVFKTSDA